MGFKRAVVLRIPVETEVSYAISRDARRGWTYLVSSPIRISISIA
jgi:hypothetical protein